MTLSTLQKRTAHYRRNLLTARQALVALVDELRDELAAARDPDLTPAERTRAQKRAYAKAKEAIDARRDAAQRALEAAQRFVEGELAGAQAPPAETTARVRALLERGRAASSILEQAAAARDVATLAALRSELEWGTHLPEPRAGLDRLSAAYRKDHKIDRALRRQVDRALAAAGATGGEELAALLDMVDHSGVPEAVEFATKSAHGHPEAAGLKRLEFAYASADEAAHASAGDDAGE